jgi:uncharacterized membrane protein HdeD (DUF308 family)
MSAVVMSDKETREVLDLAWWLYLLWGVAAVVIGFWLVWRPGVTALVIVQVLAVYWLVGGIFDSISAIILRDRDWGWRLASGVIGIVAGLVIIGHPILGTAISIAFLFWWLIFTAIITGVIDIVNGFRHKDEHGGRIAIGHILLGILKVLIGLILLERPLENSLLLVPVLGIMAIIAGVALVIMAFQVRDAVKHLPAAV